MPRLSIIIPALGDWDALETTLVSVLQNQPPGSEVLVVVNEAYADPYDLREEVRFVEAARHARLIELVNDGLAAARGEVLHVLCCGATAFDGWTDPAMRHFRDPQVGAVAPLVVDANCSSNVLTAGCTWSPAGNWTSFGVGKQVVAVTNAGTNWIGPELVAGFYRRSTLAELGAFDVSLPAELAAIDLGVRLLQRGHRSLLELASRLAIPAESLPRSGAFVQGWHSERLFWRHLKPHGRLHQLAAHGGMLLAESLGHIVRPRRLATTVGRLLGACDARAARRGQLLLETSTKSSAASADRRIDPAHKPGLRQHSAGLRRQEPSLRQRSAGPPSSQPFLARGDDLTPG